jgi:hypothetical protein
MTISAFAAASRSVPPVSPDITPSWEGCSSTPAKWPQSGADRRGLRRRYRLGARRHPASRHREDRELPVEWLLRDDHRRIADGAHRTRRSHARPEAGTAELTTVYSRRAHGSCTI